MTTAGDVLLILCLAVHVVATSVLFGRTAAHSKRRHAGARTLDSRA